MMARTNDFRVLVVMAAMALAAGLLVLVAVEKPAKAAFPGKNGLIVFTSDRDTGPNSDDLYAMAPDGSSPIRLTTTTTDGTVNQFPALSPHGTKIAFQRAQVGSAFGTSSEIWRMDVEDNNGDGDGDSLTQLTKNSDLDTKPAWSPDGSKIAFASSRPVPAGCTIGLPGCTTDLEIYVMDAKDKDSDGNGDNLTLLTDNNRFDGLPAFSPDGKKIAFASNRLDPADGTNDVDIWAMNADGSNPINLTHNAKDINLKDINDGGLPLSLGCCSGLYSQLSWSPDGTKIAFQRWESDGSIDIYTMDLTRDPNTGAITGASTPINLTNTPGLDERYPAWSPDGNEIAFYVTSNPSDVSTSEIYVMNADGSSQKNLTNNSFGDITPDWGRITKKQCDVFAGGDYIYDVLGFASEDECTSFVNTGG